MKEHIWNDVLNKKSFIYHVENNKIKEKSSKKNENVCPNFWLVLYMYLEIKE